MRLGVSMVSALCILVSGGQWSPAAGGDAKPPDCLDHSSPARTIARCSAFIGRGGAGNPTALAAAYHARGDAYFFNGDHARAISDYDEAIRLDPDNADYYMSRGAAFYEIGDPGRAKADWAQAKRLSSQ